jgi:hypothetical protein
MAAILVATLRQHCPDCRVISGGGPGHDDVADWLLKLRFA